MRGDAEDQGLLWDANVLCDELLDDEGFLATLGRARGVVFCDEDFEPLYPSRRGRPSHPPSVLAALLLAQLFYGLSDRESERRSRLDLSWKAALGLPLDHRGIPHACLAEFRARLLRAEMVEFLNTQFLRVAKQAGVIGHRRAVDSTGIADSVLTQDTVSLIRSALRRCLEQLSRVHPERAEGASSALARDDYEAPGKPHICWASAPERAALVAELFADAQLVLAACAGLDDAELVAAAALLATVAGQDIELNEDDEGRYLPAIRQGVAVERVISTVDVDARHGHRSRRDRYDGYKLHLAVDADSDLLTAAEASLATTHDAVVLPRLLAADPVAVAEVLGDTHYGGAQVRRDLGSKGIELVAPAPPASAPKGFFSKDEFVIDLEAGTVACPAGNVAVIPPLRTRGRAQARFGEKCSGCPLAARCTTSPRGRIVEVTAGEELLAPARAARWTDEFRDRYGERSRIERKAAQVKYRSPKVPWRGLVKADAWLKLKVAAMNLDRIGRLGLVGD
jgi:transposase